MDVYHEVPNDARGAVIENGLLRTSRGEKGSERMIIKTDKFLDARCPRNLRQQGVSRDNNVYAYVSVDGYIVDISNGDKVHLGRFISNSSMTVLRVEIDPSRCFVSDLDTYDALKAVLSEKNMAVKAEKLAQSYWNKIVPLSNFQINSIRRPEIMITYDVPAGDLIACN